MARQTAGRVREFRRTLARRGTQERAKQEKAYLKSVLDFHGASMPEIDAVGKAFKKENPNFETDQVLALAEALWKSTYHEERTLGLRLLALYPDTLSLETMPLLESMLERASGWAHIDEVSIHLVGTVLARHKRAYKYLRKWSKSDNFWMRRAALISQLMMLRQGEGDVDLFFRFAKKMIDEKEFFIRKAIGWVLRELSKKRPDLTFTFLKENLDRVSGLTLREGARRLPEAKRRRLL